MIKGICVRRFSSVFINDFEPHSVISIIQTTKPDVKISKSKKVANDSKKNEDKSNNNINEMGIQMINKNLSRQIFGNVEKPVFEPETIEK